MSGFAGTATAPIFTVPQNVVTNAGESSRTSSTRCSISTPRSPSASPHRSAAPAISAHVTSHPFARCATCAPRPSATWRSTKNDAAFMAPILRAAPPDGGLLVHARLAFGRYATSVTTVWTIGHSTRSLEELVALLRAHGIDTVVDVRTVP